MKLDNATLPQMPNPATGSTFFIIGEDNVKGFRAAIRFYTERAYSTGFRLGFRFRVERSPEAPPVDNMGEALINSYPSVVWIGGSNVHGSVCGEMQITESPYNVDDIERYLRESKAGASIFDVLDACFDTMLFACDRDEFNEYMVSEVGRMLREAPGFAEYQTQRGAIKVMLPFTKQPAKPAMEGEVKVKELTSEVGMVAELVVEKVPAAPMTKLLQSGSASEPESL